MTDEQPAQVELYRSKNGSIALEVLADAETVWLTRQQMASLFDRDVKTIGKHLANARREELDGIPTVAKFATVQREGDRSVERNIEHYSLDAVLSVGYRVKSPEGVHFRRWANEVLERYMVEGAALNDRRLEQIGKIVRVLARSTDTLFVHFLARNNALHDAQGVPRITNNALAAITLMVAMSDPKEKDLISPCSCACSPTRAHSPYPGRGVERLHGVMPHRAPPP